MSDFHAHSLDPGVMEAYIMIKENWIYPMLRPTVKEIFEEYMRTHRTHTSSCEDLAEDEIEEQDAVEGCLGEISLV